MISSPAERERDSKHRYDVCATQSCIPTFLTILSHVTKYSPSASAMPAVALSEGIFSQKLNGSVQFKTTRGLSGSPLCIVPNNSP